MADTHTPPYQAIAAKPVWSMDDFHTMLDVPFTTLEQALVDCPAKVFTIGRRRYIKQADALAWVDQMATRYPYTRRVDGRSNRTAKK